MLRFADETNVTDLIPRQPSVDYIHQNPYKFEVGSTVQYGEPAEYGVIKWIGMLPGRENILYAGVEMVSCNISIIFVGTYIRMFFVYIF